MTSPNKTAGDRGMPFGDVTKFRAKSNEREENPWVLGCSQTSFNRAVFRVITLTNHNRNQKQNEPMRNQRKYVTTVKRGKRCASKSRLST